VFSQFSLVHIASCPDVSAMKSTTVLRLVLVTVFVLSSVVTPGDSITDPSIPSIFYPYGPDQGDTTAPVQDDGYVGPINIPGGFPFFGTSRSALYVSILR